jgi:Rrf2 family iron-sulfur cluster assembly transcriptional regulator
MRTTTRGLYALKAMQALAMASSNENPMPLHKLAKQEEISAEFLQQIFFKLRRAGLIAAYRGPGGGFFLAKELDKISILEILEAAGESLTLSPCASIKDAAHTPCKQFSNCSAGRFWINLESEVRKYASDKSLADLISL